MTPEPSTEPSVEEKPTSRTAEMLEQYSPVPEPTFMELQQMLFGREAEVFPVTVTEKFLDDADIDQPVKVIEKQIPGLYVRVLGIDEHAKVARWLETNDVDIRKKVVRLCLCDKTGKRLIPDKQEFTGPADSLFLGAYECAMTANRFFLKKWNPAKVIAKN